MKQKNIQIMINIVTVINIIVILFMLWTIYKNNKYSGKYITKLVEKNYEYLNYIIEIETKDVETNDLTITRVTQKENYYKKIEDVINNKSRTESYDNGNLMVKDEKDNIIKTYDNQSSDDLTEPLIHHYSYNIYINLKKGYYEYEYIKSEKYNSVDCIVVEAKRMGSFIKDGIESFYDGRLWIDVNKGFILKNEIYIDNVLKEVTKYKIQIGN